MSVSSVSRNLSARDLDLCAAGHWKRAAIDMTEETLVTLKTALFDPTLPAPEPGEIFNIETMLSWLRRLDGADLVSEFCEWRDTYPGLTVGMVAAVQEREQAEQRALEAYLQPPTTVREWKPFINNVAVSAWSIPLGYETLRGVFSLELASGMVLHGVSLHEKDGSRWVEMPAREYTRAEIRTWAPQIEFVSQESREKFQSSALAAIDAYLAAAGGSPVSNQAY